MDDLKIEVQRKSGKEWLMIWERNYSLLAMNEALTYFVAAKCERPDRVYQLVVKDRVS